jgi:hypothetical protein
MMHSGSLSQRLEHYQDQAARLRDMAKDMLAGNVRDQLLDLADQYERLFASLKETRFQV